MEIGKYLEAVEAFNRCLQLNPEHAGSYYGKAKLNFLLSRTKEAIDCLRTAFSLDPNIKIKFEHEYPDIKSSRLYNRLLNEKK
jgi:tetratricopeptide (TPR) repeat protein